jgi:uncharacterized protein YdhG (YjbR/CyaY superfamily)
MNSVDEYIAAQPAGTRPILQQVRSAIQKGAPAAEESISYKIPTYKSGGGPVIYFAGWKKHFSVYPVTRALLDAFRAELASYSVEKGTIRFPLTEPVPSEFIERLAKFRADEVAAGQKRRR